MFRLPSAWDIHTTSSDEGGFSSCDNEIESHHAFSALACNSFEKSKTMSGSVDFAPFNTVQRKRPSSKLDSTFDDSDIEASPRPQVNHKIRIMQHVHSRLSSDETGTVSSRLATSIKPAHASASSIDEIELDSPAPASALLQSHKNIHNKIPGNVNGWMKSIPDSVFYQSSGGNSRSSRSKSRAAECAFIRQYYAASHQNKFKLNSTSHLIHSKTLTETHSREFLMLSVASCEPCHLPVFPVRVNFCQGKSRKSLAHPSQASPFH
jgi:hypothetical protein